MSSTPGNAPDDLEQAALDRANHLLDVAERDGVLTDGDNAIAHALLAIYCVLDDIRREMTGLAEGRPGS